MGKNEKEFTVLAVIAAAVLILWFWWEKKKAAGAVTAPAPQADFGNWPMDTGTDYSPPNLSDLQINIGNQTPNLLSQQYMPLFGFIGEAQGTYYH